MLSLLVFASMLFAEEPLFHKQWALHNQGHDHRVDITDIRSQLIKGLPGMDIGWKEANKILKTKQQEDVIIAVLDHGVDYEHEDLLDNLAWNLEECPDKKIPILVPEEDKDGNGFPGDCIGWDFTKTKDTDVKHRPLDDQGHGTHIAGIMAATGNNNLGISGVSSHIKILPVKILSVNERRVRKPLVQRVTEGVRYAVDRGAKVINLSMAWPLALTTPEVIEAFEYARSKGVFIVAASGNNGHNIPVYPCAFEEVICVGSVRFDGKASEFSNFGGHVDLVAPGEQVLSLFPMVEVPLFFPVKGYEIKSGTSQAAPYVAAAIGVLKSVYPNESYEQTLARIMFSTQEIESNKNFLAGTLRLDRALQYKGGAQIIPRFKEMSHAIINADNSMSLSIPMYNFSGVSKTANVQVTVSQSDQTVSKVTRKLSLGAYQNKKLKLVSSALNLDASSQAVIEVAVGGQSYKHELILSRPIGTNAHWKTYPIEGANIKSRIFTTLVMPGFESSFDPSYYSSEALEEGGYRLKLWKNAGESFQVNGTRNLSNARFLMGVYRLDADLDGNQDFLVMSLEMTGPEDEEYPQMVLHYLDENLQALKPGLDRVVLADSKDQWFNFAKLADPKKLYLLKQSYNGGTLLVPGIQESGLRPKMDRSRKAKRNAELSRGIHFYYLEFKPETETPELQTRVIDQHKLIAEMRKSLDLRFYDKLEPMAYLGDQKFLLRIGQLDSARPVVVELSEDAQLSWELLAIDESLFNAEAHKIIGDNDLIAYYSQISTTKAEVILYNHKTNQTVDNWVLELPDPSEFILRPLMFGKTAEGITTIIEAGQELFGFLRTSNNVQVHRQALARNTFIGQRFQQMTAPMSLRGRPALYVDNTQLNAPNVFIWEYGKQGFVSRLRNSYAVPPGCRSMSPTQWEADPGHRFAVMCGNENELSILFLPVGSELLTMSSNGKTNTRH